jgi:flagellar M-ring protein FliF
VEEIVAGVFGAGRGRVQVTAELDTNRIENRSETFDPESRAVRSTQTRAENQTSSNAEGTVSVANELPGANGQPANAPKDSSSKNEETTNYEISRTTRTEIIEGGRLKLLSVAVLVDGSYAKGANGEAQYQPRSQEDLDRIATLVRTAIGFDRNRGDQVEVVNLRFAETPAAAEIKDEGLLASLLNPSKEELLRMAEIAVLALLTLIVLLTVVRPLVKRILAPDPRPRTPALSMNEPALPAPEGNAGSLQAPREPATAKFMEIAKVTGQIQAEALEQVGQMVASNPQETVAILRNWIHET